MSYYKILGLVNPIRNKIQQINQEIKITEKQLGRDLRNLNQKEIITKEYRKYIQYVKKAALMKKR